MFAPSIGVPEDNRERQQLACLAVLLVERHPTISVDMGDALGSPATITATSRRSQARVGGDARIVETRRI